MVQSGPKNIWNPTQARTQRPKLRAVVGHKVFTNMAAQPPPLRPFRNIKPSRGKLFVREEWSWHSEGQAAFQGLDTLGHTQEYFRECMIPPKK